MRHKVTSVVGIVGAALFVASCRTPPARPSKVPPSFDVVVAGVPAGCCPTCTAIELSVRNTGDAPVAIDWSTSSMRHNGSLIHLLVDGEVSPDARSTIAAHTTWTGTLSPEPGAPNQASLEKGKLRNGRYSFDLAVRHGDAIARASTDVEVRYEQEPPQREELTAACRSAARARRSPSLGVGSAVDAPIAADAGPTP